MASQVSVKITVCGTDSDLHSNILWILKHLESPATRLFVQDLVQASVKKKLHITGTLWGESNGYHWWFPSQKTHHVVSISMPWCHHIVLSVMIQESSWYPCHYNVYGYLNGGWLTWCFTLNHIIISLMYEGQWFHVKDTHQPLCCPHILVKAW